MLLVSRCVYGAACYKLMCRGKREVMFGYSKAQMKFIFCFYSLSPPRNITESWNAVLSHVLFKFSSYINCLETLGHWRHWGYECWGFFSFSFLEMPRGEIFFVLTHCTLTSHLTTNRLYPQNVTVLSMTSSYYKYFSFKTSEGWYFNFFPTNLCFTTHFFKG